MGILRSFKLRIFGRSLVKLYSLLIISFLCISSSEFQAEDKLIGKWEATDYLNNTSEFIFTEEKTALINIRGQRFGGTDFQINGKPVELKYRINDTKSPMWLDLIASEKESGTVLLKVKGIIEFISFNKAKILLNLDNKRITYFEEKYKEMMITIDR